MDYKSCSYIISFAWNHAADSHYQDNMHEFKIEVTVYQIKDNKEALELFFSLKTG